MTRSTIWGIHAGKTGDAHTIFQTQNVISLGWIEMGDLSKLPPDRKGFKKAYEDTYPDAKGCDSCQCGSALSICL